MAVPEVDGSCIFVFQSGTVEVAVEDYPHAVYQKMGSVPDLYSVQTLREGMASGRSGGSEAVLHRDRQLTKKFLTFDNNHTGSTPGMQTHRIIAFALQQRELEAVRFCQASLSLHHE